MCTESSPRISFSSDLEQSDIITPHETTRRDLTLLDSGSDFEFCVCRNFDQEALPADEIFANGVILPSQVNDRANISTKHVYEHELPPPSPTPLLYFPPASIDQSAKSSTSPISSNPDADHSSSTKRNDSKSSSFWSFKRSLSLNYDIKKSLIRTFPLLSRSNSTGSVPNSKRAVPKDLHKQNSSPSGGNPSLPSSLSSSSTSSSSSSSSSLSSCCNVYQFMPHKPPVKKSRNGSRVPISPVSSVPPPYVSKFGFGLILRDSKDKKMKMKKR